MPLYRFSRMRFILLNALIGLCICAIAEAQQRPKVWYFSVSNEKIDVRDVIQRGPNELESSWSQMRGEQAICAIDVKVFYSGNPTSTLKLLLDGGNPVVLVGERLQPGAIRSRVLGPGARFPRRGNAKVDVVVDGIYPVEGEHYNAFTVASISPLSIAVKLKETQSELGALAFGHSSAGAEPWNQKDGASRDLVDPGFGKIVQTMTPYILVPTPDQMDHWYSRLGIWIKPDPGFGVKAHNVQVDPSQTSGVSCVGPSAAVSKQQVAVVSLNCPGPKVEWTWKTYDSQVSFSSSNSPLIEWRTAFPTGNGLATNFWWCPGLSVKNPRGQALELDVTNEVIWVDRAGRTTTHQLAWDRPLESKP